MMMVNDPSEYCVIFCTVPDSETADKIIDVLIEERLAACVGRISGNISVYRWKGEICRENEILLTIKTKCALFSEVETVIKKNHPYQVPEIIACPMIASNFQYLDWIDESTR
jgi:periplasmic divalent cation tolerance protein